MMILLSSQVVLKLYPTRPTTPNNNVLCKNMCKTLKTLKNDPNIVVLKAGKGNSIVILNKSDYASKMNTILDDSSKFRLLSSNIFNALISNGS